MVFYHENQFQWGFTKSVSISGQCLVEVFVFKFKVVLCFSIDIWDIPTHLIECDKFQEVPHLFHIISLNFFVFTSLFFYWVFHSSCQFRSIQHLHSLCDIYLMLRKGSNVYIILEIFLNIKPIYCWLFLSVHDSKNPYA